jgi:hypothetical protein
MLEWSARRRTEAVLHFTARPIGSSKDPNPVAAEPMLDANVDCALAI